jgi:putative spermidine/putrescine transport system permease protein
MRSSNEQRAPLGLKIAAAAGLLFLHLPILLIFVYAFTTEERSYQWPPPDFTIKWLAVTWNRPDIWEALGLSVKVASVSTLIALRSAFNQARISHQDNYRAVCSA